MGFQNRETPSRRCASGHWEFKALDATANPFLALSAILAAGMHGLTNSTVLRSGDCKVDPATLTAAQREGLGVTEMLPASLDDALEALRADEQLVDAFSPEFVQRYINIKRGGIAVLGAKGFEQGLQ
jgi:glutamine synthetase